MAYTFVPSPHFKPATGRKIDLIVIHTMEWPEKGDAAEGCAQWFCNPTAEVSAHYSVDNNSIIQSVRDKDVAWHARGGNHNSIGIEHAGTAKQKAREWTDAYSKAVLARSAKLAAELCKKHKVPPVWLFPADLRAGKRGITSHNNISVAFRKGDHTDPGEGFPIEGYIAMVKKELGLTKAGSNGSPAVKVDRWKVLQDDPPTLRRGSEGWEVKRLQTLLAERGYDPGEANGKFGPETERAVRELQEESDLVVDGIAGPMTWRATINAPAKRKARKKALVPA